MITKDVGGYLGVLCVYVTIRYLLARYVFVDTLVWGSPQVGGPPAKAYLTLEALSLKVIACLLRTFLPPLPDLAASVISQNLYLSPTRLAALALGGSALILGLGRFLWSRRMSPAAQRSLRMLATLLGCFVVMLPLLGPFSVSLTDTQGERLLYTSSVFASVAVASMVVLAPKRYRGATIVGIAILLGWWAVNLREANGNWRVASELARRISDQIASQATQQYVLLASVPDSYRGAWVYREGLEAAVRIFHQSSGVVRIGILSRQSVWSIQDEVSVTCLEGTGHSVQLRGQRGQFVEVNDNEMARIGDSSRRSFTFSTRLNAPRVDIMFYTAGRVRVVGVGQSLGPEGQLVGCPDGRGAAPPRGE
jgi:hypothetical protein